MTKIAYRIRVKCGEDSYSFSVNEEKFYDDLLNRFNEFSIDEKERKKVIKNFKKNKDIMYKVDKYTFLKKKIKL